MPSLFCINALYCGRKECRECAIQTRNGLTRWSFFKIMWRYNTYIHNIYNTYILYMYVLYIYCIFHVCVWMTVVPSQPARHWTSAASMQSMVGARRDTLSSPTLLSLICMPARRLCLTCSSTGMASIWLHSSGPSVSPCIPTVLGLLGEPCIQNLNTCNVC